MTVYIDMYNALKEFKPDEWGTPDERQWPENKIAAYLIAIPAADVRPVEYGEWIFDDPLRGDFMCSKCLERQIVCSRYCPNCGAEMRKWEIQSNKENLF